MARTVQEITDGIITDILARPTLANMLGLDPGLSLEEQTISQTAFWYNVVVIFAIAANVVEGLFDTHKTDVNDDLEKLKPHSPSWYSQKAKSYVYGAPLEELEDSQDLSGYTDEQIEELSIIDYVAINEVVEGGISKLEIKVAKEGTGGDLEELTEDEKNGFSAYMEHIKDAGVFLSIISRPADLLRQTIIIYYDELILDANGARLDGSGATPVQDAHKEYLKNLPFNGELILAYLTDALQKVEGVVVPHLSVSEYKDQAGAWQPIDIRQFPFSGYFSTTEDEVDYLTITFTPNGS